MDTDGIENNGWVGRGKGCVGYLLWAWLPKDLLDPRASWVRELGVLEPQESCLAGRVLRAEVMCYLEISTSQPDSCRE